MSTLIAGSNEAALLHRSSVFKRLPILLAGVTLATGPVWAGSKEHVEGLGWVPTKVVTTCLQAVGEEDTDALTDWKWDDFVTCVRLSGASR